MQGSGNSFPTSPHGHAGSMVCHNGDGSEDGKQPSETDSRGRGRGYKTFNSEGGCCTCEAEYINDFEQKAIIYIKPY